MVDRLVRLDAVWEADLPNLTEIQIARGEAGSKRVARDHGRWTSLLAAGEGAVIDASRMHLRMDSCRWVGDRIPGVHDRLRSQLHADHEANFMAVAAC